MQEIGEDFYEESLFEHIESIDKEEFNKKGYYRNK